MTKKSAKDIQVGDVFWKYTVLYQAPSKGGKRCWHCRCECGQEKDVIGTNLVKGFTKSCGCYRANRMTEINKESFIDMTGWKMSEHGVPESLWTVISLNEESTSKEKKWLCECQCGTQKIVTGGDLRRGQSLSCGCLKNSKGVLKILELLKNHKIEREKIFDKCRDQRALPFDFYIDNRYLIEFDGEQHYIAKESWGGEENLIYTQKHDKIKNDFCLTNHIPLIRVPYYVIKDLTLQDLLPETSKYLIKKEEV